MKSRDATAAEPMELERIEHCLRSVAASIYMSRGVDAAAVREALSACIELRTRLAERDQEIATSAKEREL